MSKIPVCILIILAISCSTEEKQSENPEKKGQYSENFRIHNKNGYKLLEVSNPWQKADNINFQYILCSDPSSIPESSSAQVIEIPVQRVIVFSTTHVGYIQALDKDESIIGVSGKNYIYNKKLREKIESDKITDIGFVPSVDYEKIIDLNPDVVFIYGVESSVSGVVSRLNKSGITCVLIADYLEKHPLGKLEWLNFFSCFYKEELLAEKIVKEVSENYQRLKEKTLDIKNKPKVLSGLPWKDTWYMPGGKSFAAQLIYDAGGRYIWKDDDNEDVIPLDLETAFMKGLNADVWINAGTASSVDHITGRDSRFAAFKSVKQKNIFNNNNRINNYGGNDYWESGVTNPDVILNDMIKIFHPGINEEHSFIYFKRLE